MDIHHPAIQMSGVPEKAVAHTSRRLYSRDILLIVAETGLLQISFPGIHTEVLLQLVHLFIGYGIHKW